MITKKTRKLHITIPQLAEYQRRIVESPKRFTITEGSAKCGKTMSHIWWFFREAHLPIEGHADIIGYHYWWIAPVYKQAQIAFNRICKKIRNNPAYKVNISTLEITTPMGSIMAFKSGQDADALYGEDVFAAVVDEGSRMEEASWLALRSTLVATGGKCKLIGNVKGIDNWYYKLARKVEAGELPNWEYFKFTADDAVKAKILTQEEIDEARATYPEGIFLELFYAIPFVNTQNKFAFSFNYSKHVGKTEFNKNHFLYLSFDFNKNPICCSVFQHFANKIYGIETIKLPNSNIYELCKVIRSKYPNAIYVVNGDATGRVSTALTKDNLNYYIVIKNELKINHSQLKVPAVNPRVEENQLLVNAILEHYDVVLDKEKCEGLIKDLLNVEMLPDGTIKKANRDDPNQQADALDTFRYYLNMNFKWFLKKPKPRKEEEQLSI